jgi:hypothetical protein
MELPQFAEVTGKKFWSFRNLRKWQENVTSHLSHMADGDFRAASLSFNFQLSTFF